MADGEGTGIGTVFLVALAVVVVFAFVSCNTGTQPTPVVSGPVTPSVPGSLTSGAVLITNQAQLDQMVGADVVAQGVRVQHVAADEGFWVALSGGRAWVQLIGVGESPYTVRDGDLVSFHGTVVAHGRTFPDGLAMCTPQDAEALAAVTTHVDVPYDALSFGVG